MEKRIKAFPEKSSLLALLMKVLKVSYWILPFRILKKFRKKAIPPLTNRKKGAILNSQNTYVFTMY
jgi:hypothetical protein